MQGGIYLISIPAQTLCENSVITANSDRSQSTMHAHGQADAVIMCRRTIQKEEQTGEKIIAKVEKPVGELCEKSARWRVIGD